MTDVSRPRTVSAAYALAVAGVLISVFGTGALLVGALAALQEAATGSTAIADPTDFSLVGAIIFFIGVAIVFIGVGIWEDIQ